MVFVTQGVVHGNTIELKEPPAVADGQEVEVVVRIVQPNRTWGEGIRRSAGACADLEGFDEAFEQVARDRKAATFREPPQ